MVIDGEGSTVWEGTATLLDPDKLEAFLTTLERANEKAVGIIAKDRETVQKTVDKLNMERLRKERLKREHRRRR